MEAEGARRAADEEEYRATVDLRSQRFRARVVVASSVLLCITLCVLAAADPDDGGWRPTVLEEVSHDRGWEEVVKLKFEPFIALADWYVHVISACMASPFPCCRCGVKWEITECLLGSLYRRDGRHTRCQKYLGCCVAQFYENISSLL